MGDCSHRLVVFFLCLDISVHMYCWLPACFASLSCNFLIYTILTFDQKKKATLSANEKTYESHFQSGGHQPYKADVEPMHAMKRPNHIARNQAEPCRSPNRHPPSFGAASQNSQVQRTAAHAHRDRGPHILNLTMQRQNP